MSLYAHYASLGIRPNAAVLAFSYLGQGLSSCVGSLQTKLGHSSVPVRALQRQLDQGYIPLATEVYGLCKLTLGVPGLVVGGIARAAEIRKGERSVGLTSPSFLLDISGAICIDGLKNMLTVPTALASSYVAYRFFT